jgi:hypothetical protein
MQPTPTHRRVVAMVAALVALSAAVLAVGAAAQDSAPVASGAGWFHSDCDLSHRAKSDPIVVFGQPGVSHSHDFFGNRTTGDFTTNASLRFHAQTTCERDDEERDPSLERVDASAYWVPSLSVNGGLVNPGTVTAGYSVGKRPRSVAPFPEDLRVISGTSSGGPRFDGKHRIWNWRCVGGTVAPASSPNRAPTCGSGLILDLNFQDCWDGRNVDSTDHKSHMAFSQPIGGQEVCPPSHPVLVPQLQLQVRYATKAGPSTRLATGSGAAANLNGGMDGAHGDFMNGWDPAALARLVDVCLNGDEYCGGTDFPVPDH